MKKSRFTEEQITFALKEAEIGEPVAEICRRLGVSQQSFCYKVDFPVGNSDNS